MLPYMKGTIPPSIGVENIMTDLNGQVALVTGASRGIGRAISIALLDAGAFVIACARQSPDLDSLGKLIAQRGEIWAIDATSDEFLDRISKLETLNILIGNLGINFPEPFHTVSDEHLDSMIAVNIRTTFRVAREAVRKMDEGGAIVHITSQMGHVGSPNRTAYCMTKHAIEGLTKAMAVELAPKQIRVNAVAPTFIETALTKPMLEDPSFKEFVNRMIPLGRMGHVNDVAAAALYLCSEGASMVTGHSLLVDGGWTAQ